MARERDDEAGVPGAIALVEETLHLLRRVPTGWWVLYAVGAFPWVAGMLWAWSHVTWFAPGGGFRAWIALGLAALYFHLKTMQAMAAARLLAWRSGKAPEPWRWRDVGSLALAQVRLQAWGLIALPVTSALILPFGWTWAYYQSATVIGADSALSKEACARAMEWPRQNHLGLLWLAIFGGVVWLNVAACAYVVPWLANRLLGIENMFAVDGIIWFNSTFYLVVTLLAWLVVDPVVKAFYVLRVFYGRARESGEDLRVELNIAREEARRRRLGTALAAGAVLLVALGAAAPSSRAQSQPAESAGNGGRPAAVSDAELEAAIDRALRQSDFQWQLPPPPREEEHTTGAVEAFFRDGWDALRSVARTIRDWFGKLERWLNRRGSPGPQVGDGADGGGEGWAPYLLYSLLIVLLALLGWVLWLIFKQASRAAPDIVTATAVAAAKPDLNDERVHAAQLPLDEWLELARECMQAGDWRLALRALYLAQLAHFGAAGWLKLHRAKTNLDYERELHRRAGHRDDLIATFRGRRRTFEGAWYGRDEVAPAEVESWMAELVAAPAGAGVS